MARSNKGLRKVRLLSAPEAYRHKVDPSEWFNHQKAKQFDATNTAILRVFRHQCTVAPVAGEKKGRKISNGTFLVYGMRSVDGKKQAEAYELAATQELLDAAVARVAEHCGVTALVQELK